MNVVKRLLLECGGKSPYLVFDDCPADLDMLAADIVDTGKIREGFFIAPTIFDNVSPQHAIAQEEIFGPVLSVMTFQTEEEAIELANNTCYGLAAYIATENMGRAQRFSQEINSGLVLILGTSTPVSCYREIGREGHRESGFGSEGGLSGLLSYSLSTAVHQWT